MRKPLLTLFALACFGLALWVIGAAFVAEALTGQVLMSCAPLAMLGGIAWSARTRGEDDDGR